MIPIYIPSKARSHKLNDYSPWLRDYPSDAHLVVTSDEESAYKEVTNHKVIVHPQECCGNMSKVRNFILNHATSTYGEGQWIAMFDDDVSKLRTLPYYAKCKADLYKTNWISHATGESVYKVLKGLIETYGDSVLIGTNGVDNEFYKTGVAKTYGFVCADGCLIKLDGSRYDETIKVKEDYFYTAQSLTAGKKIYSLGTLCVHSRHYNAGGCQSYSEKREALDLEAQQYLLKKFPDIFAARSPRKNSPHELRFKRLKIDKKTINYSNSSSTMIKEAKIAYDSDIIDRRKIEIDRIKTEEACKNGCNCYGKKGSCPPYSPLFSKLYPKETHLFVYYVGFEKDFLEDLKKKIGLYKTIGVINTILAHMSNRIGRSLNPTMRYLSSGTCKICAAGGLCNYRNGVRVCKHPEKRRYSMESTGIVVNSITKQLFGWELDWWKKGTNYIPERIIQAGGILCQDYDLKILNERLQIAINREENKNVTVENRERQQGLFDFIK